MKYYDLNIAGFHRKIKEYRLASGVLIDKFMKTVFTSDKYASKVTLSVNSRLKLKKFRIKDPVYTYETKENIEKMISHSLSDVLSKYKRQADELRENIQARRKEICQKFSPIENERE